MRDGNELLLLHTAIDASREHAEEAALALRAVAMRVAESEDRIARLEMFADRVHELDPELYERAIAEFGWSDL